MKKMIAIALVIFLVGFVLTATRVWSTFTPNLQLRGATLSSLSSDLLLSNVETPALHQYQAFGELKGAQSIIPGGQEFSEFFWVWNKNQEVPLQLFGKFLSGNGDWAKLAPLIEVQITPSDKQFTAPWFPLSQLAENRTEIIQNFGSNEQKKIVVNYRMVTRYPFDPDGSGPLDQGDYLGAEIQNLTSSGIGLELSALRIQ
jgi:hypothetical protein